MQPHELIRIKKKAERQLFKIPGVHVVGIGGRCREGKPTGETSIKVFVLNKRPLSTIDENERIPAEFDGVPTDVEEMPELVRTQAVPGKIPLEYAEDRGTYRILRGGIMITSDNVNKGTLGCFVKDGDDRVFAVTNQHVLYRSATDEADGEAVGQPVVEESSSGCCKSGFGEVFATVHNTKLDISLVKLDEGTSWLAEVQEIGVVRGQHNISPAEADTGTYQVQKRGFRTGRTGGFVQAINATGTSHDENNNPVRNYDNGIVIRANDDPAHPGVSAHIGARGDSGSALLNLSNEVVGVVFLTTGNREFAAALPIQDVIDHFNGPDVDNEQRVSLQVATATEPNQVQVVTERAMTADLRAAVGPRMPKQQILDRLEKDIEGSALGHRYIELCQRHAKEVNYLINTNRRVATVWHRSGGATLFRALVRCFYSPDECVPQDMEGRSLSACIDQMAAILITYGSAALKADVSNIRPTLPDVSGLTYRDIIERLNSREMEYLV